MKLLNNKKIQVIALFALILALLSLSVASDIVPGMNGTNGTNGSDGAPGTPGSPGTPGANGINGINGTNGTNGSPGSDGADGAPGVNGTNAVSFSGGVVFYLHNTTSNNSIPSKEMNRTIRADLPTTYLNVTALINGNTNLINFSSSQLLINFIPGGLYQLNVHAMKTTAGGAHTNTLYYELWVTNSTGGNASYIGTSSQSTVIVNGVDNSDAIDLVLPDRDFNMTDRLVVKIFASQTGSGLLPNFQLFFDGLTDSRFIIPSSALTPAQLTSIVEPLLNHNNITNLQGGNITERFHFNSSLYDLYATRKPSCGGLSGYSVAINLVGYTWECTYIPIAIPDDTTWQTTKADKTDLDTKVNKSGDIMTGNLTANYNRIENFSFLSLRNSGTTGFDVQNMGSSVVNSIAVGTLGNMNVYGNWNSTLNNVSDPTKNVWALRTGIASTQANYFKLIWIQANDPVLDIAGTAKNTVLEWYKNETVKIMGNITATNYNGSGNAYACLDSNGKLYRGSPGC